MAISLIKVYKKMWFVRWLLLVLFIVSYIFYKVELHLGHNSSILSTIGVMALVTWFSVNKLLAKYSIVGKIVFGKETITICDSVKEDLSVSKITEITFRKHGYRGEGYPWFGSLGLFASKDGVNKLIIKTIDNKEICMYLIVQDKDEMSEFSNYLLSLPKSITVGFKKFNGLNP